uniref:cysteine-rich receptor-like protein kinase 29 n=1 Tax=Fragaria vesca subsp. vesca TaxID=101020 RepID=UPI0005CA0F22|nr:PREDICTED: cysteine-rich receptor-like protein kinase 29 [Fragaria vesca subsp. vesca]
MVSSRSRLFLSLIPLIITITNIRPTHQDGDDFRYDVNTCHLSSFNGTFGKNLNHLFSSMLSSSKANTSTGFYSSSYGAFPDKAYAIGICRGDLKPRACAACLSDSTATILHSACPDTKEGVIGYINCTVRYSNISISGIRVEAPAIWGGNSEKDKVSTSLGFDFNQRLTTLFETLRNKAAAGSSVLKFAVGHSNAPVSSGITIYGLAQCSPDLSEADCGVCFSKALEQLPPCCFKSWFYIGASCTLAYKPYLFYDPATDPTPLPLPSTTTSNSGGIESSTAGTVDVNTIVPIVVSMLLIVSLCLSNDLG